jgi:hypothetical protein
MKNIFKTNSFSNIKKEYFLGTNIFTMDNFFTNPDMVVEYIQQHKSVLYKSRLKPSYNGDMFYDKRHTIIDVNFANLQKKLMALQIGSPLNPGKLLTNVFSMKNHPFNDYTNCYWRPHRDDGYTCLIYLNKYNCAGTNLYDEITTDVKEHNDNAHFAPWRQKTHYQLIKTIPSSYNKMVIFNGKQFLHGMAIEDDRWCDEERLNIVTFYRDSR